MTVPSGYLSSLFSRKSERQEIIEVRRTILDKFLYVFSWVGLPAVVLGAIRSYTQGRWETSIIYVALYLLFVLATLPSLKFPFRIKALILISSLFLVALTSMAMVGMSGSGIQLMLGVCFLSALLFGLRGVMLALLVTLLCLGVLAIGMTMGFIDIPSERMMTSGWLVSWLTTICVFFIIVSITVIGFQVFSRRIEESLDLLEEHKRELEAANENLKEASVIISKSRAVAFLWSTREGWPVEYVSDNVENVFGYTAEEFLTGRIVYDRAIHPEDLPRVTGEVNRFSRDPGREGFTHEPYRIVTKQGEVRWVEDTTQLRRDSKGEITHYQGIVQDITERKLIEKELQSSSDVIRAIIEAVPAAIIGLDLEGNVRTVWNPAAEKMLGWSAREVMGRPLPTVSMDRQEEFRSFRDRIRGGMTLDGVEVRRQRRDGTPIDYSIYASPLHDSQGQISGNIAVMVDITERKRSEEKIKEANSGLQMLQQITASVHSTLDLEEVFRQITDSFVYSMGYNSAVIIKRNDERNRFEIKALSSKTWILTEVDKLLGFNFKDYSFSVNPGSNAAVDAVLRGEMVVAKTAEEFGYPLFSKTTCSMLQELGGIKNYILVPLQVDKEVVGGVIITSLREEVTEEEFKMVSLFAQVASHAIQNADLHTLTQQTKDALREKEEKYRLIAENMADIIAVLDVNLRFTYISPSIMRIRGFTVEEAMGQTLDQTMAPESLKLALSAFEEEMKLEASRTADPERMRTMEVEEYRKDGSSIWLEVSLSFLRNENQTAVGILSVSRDISERKRAEDALRKSEEYFRAITENASDIIFIVDGLGIITYASPSIERFIGYRPEELIGKGGFDLILPDDHPRASEDFGQALLTKEVVIPNSFRVRHKDGHERVLEGVGMNLMDNPAIAGFVMNVRDVTDRRREEEERRNLETKLQRAQKMEAIGLMAGGVAHDLNNMLSAFVSLPEVILMDIPEENQKLRKEIQLIMSSGQKDAAIVDDLLTITRGVTMARDALNLNKVVQEYMGSPEFEKPRYFDPGIEVVTELADDLLPIRGSRVHLMKALMNLISNGSEAFRSSDSGVVSVSTQNRYVDAPLQGYERVNIGEYAVLTVKDNGMGISPEDMERIFEPFYTKKVMGKSGTGLGLTVVWNTVASHDGYIQVESGGGGTVFELYFPITRDSVFEKEIPLDLNQYQGRGEKVLVVDDELDQRVIAVGLLSKLGYQAVAVAGGQEALEFLKEHEVDILLLDMVMPGMDGCDTFSRIVQLKPGQKAVIASGFSLSDRVRKAQELGAGAYIRKPYSVEKLGRAIKTELDKSL